MSMAATDFPPTQVTSGSANLYDSGSIGLPRGMWLYIQQFYKGIKSQSVLIRKSLYIQLIYEYKGLGCPVFFYSIICQRYTFHMSSIILLNSLYHHHCICWYNLISSMSQRRNILPKLSPVQWEEDYDGHLSPVTNNMQKKKINVPSRKTYRLPKSTSRLHLFCVFINQVRHYKICWSFLFTHCLND